MLRELLIDVFTKWRISDITLLILLFMSFAASWITILTLGLKILKTEIKLKHIIPGALAGACTPTFIRPFLPEMLTFFIVLIPLLLFLKLLSKSKWIIVTWATILLLLSTFVFPVLLTVSNHTLASFIHGSGYKMIAITFTETLGPALLLGILYLFDISLIPNPNRSLTTIDFIDIFPLLTLLYFILDATINIWENPNRFLKPLIGWFIAAGGIVAFSIHIKVKDKKKDEKYKQLEQLEESKLDTEKVETFCKLIIDTINNPSNNPLNDIALEFGDLLDIYFNRRERDVLNLIAQGKDNNEIAETLYLAPGTIANLVNIIKSKTQVPDRNRLMLYAMCWVRQHKDKPVKKPKSLRVRAGEIL